MKTFGRLLSGGVVVALASCSQSSDWYERTVEQNESRDSMVEELVRHGYSEAEARHIVWTEEMRYNTETAGSDDVVRDGLELFEE